MQSSKWADKTVLVVGDVMLDVTLRGTITRHAPDCATCPVVDVPQREFRPGGAANAAANVVAYRGKALLCGAVARSHATADLSAILLAFGVNPGSLHPCRRHTTEKMRVYVGRDQILRVDREDTGPLDGADEAAIVEHALALLPGANAVLISDYAKGVCTPNLCQTVIRAARARGLPVVVDPKGGDWSKYTGATVIKPNLAEWKRCRRPVDFQQFPAVLITKGAEGMTLLRRGSPHPLRIPAVPREDFPVIGAGDRVAAVLALALAAGADVETAARTAAQLVGEANPCNL